MLYSASILVPSGSSVANPYRQDISISPGVVKRLFVRWRSGSGRLCGCRILQGNIQRWPYSLGEWFISAASDTIFEENLDISEPPNLLTIESYNEDDSYDHRLWLGFVILLPTLSDKVLWMLQQLGGG